jgi:hypothetical protein
MISGWLRTKVRQTSTYGIVKDSRSGLSCNRVNLGIETRWRMLIVLFLARTALGFQYQTVASSWVACYSTLRAGREAGAARD